MLKLGGKVVEFRDVSETNPMMLRVSKNKHLPSVLKAQQAYLISDADIPDGFSHYLVLSTKLKEVSVPKSLPLAVLPDDYAYLGEGDVVRLSPSGSAIRVLFRASSSSNSILVTEQCNHYCLMCSQPPKEIDDSYIIDEIEQLIPLIPKDTKEIGFTGGEPFLLGDRFLRVLELTKNYLPQTAIHILSNGRAFANREFNTKYATLNLPDAMVGIPIYSDDATTHDYIVQAKGAFDETIEGIINLKRLNQRVEVRVVLHALSIPRLIYLSEFIARNLLFVDHVALMALEITGFTRANMDKLWIDPVDYREVLTSSTKLLKKAGMNVSIYNHPLCLVDESLNFAYRKSISDWKNEYPPECDGCIRRNECGGFFSSGLKHQYSQSLKPFK